MRSTVVSYAKAVEMPEERGRDETPIDAAAAFLHGSAGAFAAAWEAASDAMALSNPEGLVLLANPAYHRLYGYPPEAVLGCSFAVIFPEEERAAAEAQYRAIFRGPGDPPGFEAAVRRADGTERMVDARYTFLYEGGRRVAMLSVIRDITERTALEGHLRAAVAERERFMVTAAHELRTPLTVMKGYAQLVARQLRRPDWARERILAQFGRLHEQIARLDALINDLFDVSQLQMARLALHRERVDLAAIARRVLEQARHAPERTAAHRLVLDGAGPVWLDADPGRLEQVVANLVTNALKYSPDGGEVRCIVRREDDRATLIVSDQGLGIAPEAQGQLFRPFSRAASTARDIGGTGLGLYITRELVERHGGTIALSSVPGQGTVFRVSLPLAVTYEASAAGPDEAPSP
jgi:PAS domain S-box-containing protein